MNTMAIIPQARLDDWRSFAGVRTRRSLAFLVDYAMVLLLCIPAGLVVFILGIFTLGLAWFLIPSLFAIVALLYVSMTMGGPKQATLGMQLFSIALMRTDGQPVDFFYAMVHTILFWLSVSILTPFVLLATLLLDHKQFLHDLALGTVVVRTDF